MTMPAIVPGLVPTIGIVAPNAAPAGQAPAPGAADANVTAQFNAVLSILLGAQTSVAVGAPDAQPAPQLASEVVEGGETQAGESVEMPEASAFMSLEVAADAAISEAAPKSTTTTKSTDSIDVEIATAIAAAPIPAVAMPNVIAPADTRVVRSGTELLTPDFRDRLERVIDRMESEYGYKVEVTETFRSQARQDALYARGRTEPGQVVTWTRASNHTAGRAADLVVDGSYENGLPYERLMRIAREEGLRTLGPRDPGHIELPSSAASVSSPSASAPSSVIARPSPSIASHTSIAPAIPELESQAGGVARVAPVAPVAQVARVSQVAQVAMVAAQTTPAVHTAAPRTVRSTDSTRTVAPSSRAAGENALTLPTTTNPVPTVIGSANGAQTSGDGTTTPRDGEAEPNEASPRRARGDNAASRDTAAQVFRESRDELVRAVTTVEPNATPSSTTSAGEASSIGHADMSERIARLLKVQDAASDRPLSQVLLRLERPDGGEDRLRVDLRGNTVSATLDVGDQGAADRLGANVKELQRALERHGFETDSLTVRTATRAVESATLSRAAGASVEADLQRATAPTTSNTSTNTSSRERGARHDDQHGQRPSPDSQRQRSRREQKGDR